MIKQNYLFIPIIFALFVSPSYLSAQDLMSEGCSNNYSSLVFEDKTGKIIFETRSDEKIYPASLTKLMTLYLTFEAIKEKKISMDKIITASDRAEYTASINKTNTLKLKVGSQMTVENAIKFAIVKSFNEAAEMLAEEVAGSEWEFVREMNKKALKLGMLHTNFRNASGLFDPGQYTTDYDLARLAMALRHDFPEYYHFFALKEFTLNNVLYSTHNHVLLKYKGAEGMKTGFTNMSGFNLIAIAKKNDERIISVLTSCASYQKRDAFTKQLLDKSFEKLYRDKNQKNILEVTIDDNLKKEPLEKKIKTAKVTHSDIPN